MPTQALRACTHAEGTRHRVEGETKWKGTQGSLTHSEHSLRVFVAGRAPACPGATARLMHASYTHTHTLSHTHTHTNTHKHTHNTHTDARARARMHTRTHMHTYAYTHMHAYIHTCSYIPCSGCVSVSQFELDRTSRLTPDAKSRWNQCRHGQTSRPTSVCYFAALI
jgi:hypothetical protein